MRGISFWVLEQLGYGDRHDNHCERLRKLQQQKNESKKVHSLTLVNVV